MKTYLICLVISFLSGSAGHSDINLESSPTDYLETPADMLDMMQGCQVAGASRHSCEAKISRECLNLHSEEKCRQMASEMERMETQVPAR